MTEKKVNDAVTDVTQSLYSSNQAIVETTAAAQQRNAKLAQNVAENGIEVFKSQAESARDVLGELIQKQQEAWEVITKTVSTTQEQDTRGSRDGFEYGTDLLKNQAEGTRNVMTQLIQKQQEAWQVLTASAVAAQERNMQYAQSIFENSIQVLQSHAESTRSLMQTLIDDSHRRQQAYRTLVQASFDAYRSFLAAPISYFEQAAEVSETAGRQGQKIAHKAVENSKQAAHKAAE
jgi:uncharacterized membrane-anchored protein YhcB (DUF1043 family)